jgi:hypothetical protein
MIFFFWLFLALAPLLNTKTVPQERGCIKLERCVGLAVNVDTARLHKCPADFKSRTEVEITIDNKTYEMTYAEFIKRMQRSQPNRR